MVITQRTFAIALTKGVLNIVLPNLVWQRRAQPLVVQVQVQAQMQSTCFFKKPYFFINRYLCKRSATRSFACLSVFAKLYLANTLQSFALYPVSI